MRTPLLESISSATLSSGLVLVLLPLIGRECPAQSVERMSVSSSGVQGDQNSLQESALTPDGRYVVFQSDAANLVANDANAARDIFVRDRFSGTTTRVSLSSAGVPSNGSSTRPSISADGRWVAFESQATNLVAGDANGSSDVFLHDRLTGATTLASVSSAGVPGNADSFSPDLSADGQWLAFGSRATNLVAAAGNGVSHVFLRELATGVTSLVSVTPAGALENGSSGHPSLSADGRFVAFSSGSSNLLVAPSLQPGVYVRDRVAGTTVAASLSSGGVEGNSSSSFPSISGNGTVVAFQSHATNLVPGDTNFVADVFVRDLALGLTERASVSSTGVQANLPSDAVGQPPRLSSDGRLVVFASLATNLVPGSLGFPAIYRRDRVLGATSLVARSTLGAEATGQSFSPSMSSNGRFVALSSSADNLVPADTNGVRDVFQVDFIELVLGQAPAVGGPFFFRVEGALGEAGNVAVVLLSCTGTEFFPLPPGHGIQLTPDACTTAGLELGGLFFAVIDAAGSAVTPSFPFPNLTAGFPFHAAAITLDAGVAGVRSITAPVSFQAP